MNIEIAVKQLEALANKTRLSLYRRLVKAGNDGLASAVCRKQPTSLHPLCPTTCTVCRHGPGNAGAEGDDFNCRANYPAMHGLVEFLVAECCSSEPCADPSDEDPAEE